MSKMFPRYGVTGNGYDAWDLDIFWGNHRVTNVQVFKAKYRQHSTKERTDLFRRIAYMKARDEAIKEMERLRKEDPVRPADAPPIEKKKK